MPAENGPYHTRLSVTCDPELAQILIAETSAIGFDSFLESDEGLEAYAEGDHFDREALTAILNRYSVTLYSLDRVEKKNWNEIWEESYKPVIVEGRCLIRAHFHTMDTSPFPYVITVTPKMSFGTGHHQTTYLMVQAQMELDHTQKRVMDAGCGTAILSIFASMRGAKKVEAFDIDEWSITNAAENCEVNHCTNVHARLGKIADLSFGEPFDIILANINKNILLEEMPTYVAHLADRGQLLLSGFYEQDIPELDTRAQSVGLKKRKTYTREFWAAILYTL
jgi:ribosomal protein L11 methyltransferase